ncbi:MAG: hypothetical protein RIQ70_171 [Bacteroidota bacterium]
MLHFTVEGEGKTLVFLHGFLESSTMWSYLDLNELPAQRIFIDLPGHGKSELTDTSERPSIDFMTEEVMNVLTKLRIESYSVIGHSMGGYVGLLLKEKDNRCEKVILMNSNFWADSEQKKKDRLRIAEIAYKAKRIFIQEAIPNLFAFPENNEIDILRLKEEAMTMNSESIAYAALAMRTRKDFSSDIRSENAPYFVIHGEEDNLATAEQYLTYIKDEHLFVVKQAGHMSHIEKPGEIQQILRIILLNLF